MVRVGTCLVTDLKGKASNFSLLSMLAVAFHMWFFIPSLLNKLKAFCCVFFAYETNRNSIYMINYLQIIAYK